MSDEKKEKVNVFKVLFFSVLGVICFGCLALFVLTRFLGSVATSTDDGLTDFEATINSQLTPDGQKSPSRTPFTLESSVDDSYDGSTKWEDSRSRMYTLDTPIPAGTIIKIRGPRFVDSGLFTVWVLDEDKVKSQLLMNTTDSYDSENFRLRGDAYYLDIDTSNDQLWRIEIESLP